MTSSRFWKNLHPLIRRKRKPLYEDDTNFAILNAIDNELKDLEETTVRSKIQSSLKTSTGEFLEEYGDFFGIYRREVVESDEVFRDRIVEAVNIPRGTNESIRSAVRSYLEDNTLGIEVYEPWVDIFYLNSPRSRMSGRHKLQGVYYHFAVIDVHIGSPFEEDIVDIINDYKPAGVTLHITYDPSLRPFDGNLTGAYGTIPYIRDTPRVFEDTLEMDNPYLQPARGSIKMSDVRISDRIFNLNTSRTSSKDKLSSGYGTRLGNIHLAGKAGEYTPSEDTLMRNLSKELELLEEDFYLNRDEKNDNMFKVKLRPTSHLYVILNIDELVGTRHSNIRRNSGEYEGLMGGSSIQISFKAEQGIEVELQAYNFDESGWEPIGRVIATNKVNNLATVLPREGRFLNGNQLAFIRLKVPKDITLGINHINMDYASDKGISPVGMGVKAIPSHPIVLDEVRDFPEEIPYPYE